jgi:PAS domain S-box-containing protein
MRYSIKLTILAMAIALSCTTVMTTIVYTLTASSLEEEIKDRLQGQAFHTLDKIDRLIFERSADIKVLANDPVLTSRASTPAQITDRLSFYKTYGVYSSLSFFNPDRIRLADTAGAKIGRQHPLDEYWPEILQGKEFVMVEAWSRSIQQPIISFATPVKDDRGDLLGVVASIMPVTVLNEIVAKALGNRASDSKVLKGVEMELLDRDGVVLYSNSNPGAVLKEKSEDLDLIQGAAAAGVMAYSGKHLHRGEEEITTFVREQGYMDFKGNGWMLVMCVPTEVVYAPALHLRNQMVGLSLAIYPVILLLALFFAKRVTRPLTSLKDAVVAMGKGDFGQEVAVTSEDEIGQLAKAFNTMSVGLKESEAKYQDLAELLPQLVYEIDVSGRVVFANRNGLAMFGYTQDDLAQGLMAAQVFVPEDQARVEEDLERELQGEIASDMEYTAMRKDGTTFPLLTFDAPIRQGDRIVGIRGIGIDISERKRQEEALAAEKNKLLAIINAMEHLMHIIDPNFTILFQNPISQGVFGNQAGKRCYQAFEGGGAICANCPVQSVFADGETHVFEKETKSPTVGHNFVEITATPIKNAEGEITSCLEIVKIITGRKQAEAASQRQLDEVERLNELMVGRELKMEELRQRIALLEQGHDLGAQGK